MRSPLRVFHLLAAVAAGLLGGCKCNSSRTVEAPAPTRAQAPPLSAVDAGDQAPPPLTLATLSVLEPSGTGCEWKRVEALTGRHVLVARFDGDCRGARIAWSADDEQAVVWFDPDLLHAEASAEDPEHAQPLPSEGTPRLFLVQLKTGKVKPLTLPKVAGSVDEVALSSEGNSNTEVVALVQESLPHPVREAGRVDIDGEPLIFDPEAEGLPALAHAYRLGPDGAWTRFETKLTSEGWDDALGVDALDVAGKLGPRSIQLLAPHYQGDTVTNPGLLTQLEPFVPLGGTAPTGAARGGWIQGGSAAGRFFVWETSAGGTYTSGRVLLDSPQGPVPAPELEFDEHTPVSLRVQGAFLLVAHSATGQHPKLYDLGTRRRLFASRTARATLFWPGAARREEEAPP